MADSTLGKVQDTVRGIGCIVPAIQESFNDHLLSDQILKIKSKKERKKEKDETFTCLLLDPFSTCSAFREITFLRIPHPDSRWIWPMGSDDARPEGGRKGET